MKRSLPVIAALFCFLAACEKDELPKPASGTPSANTIQVSMGSDYANQLFFDLGTASIVSHNDRAAWDLGFACGANGRHIILNSSKFMAMSKTGLYDLSAVTAATPVTWLYDNQAGKEDSSCFYNWELNQVYIIDKGISTGGQQLGKLKLQVIDQTEINYTIRWGTTLDATQFQTAVIAKSDARNFSFFSFTSGQQVTIEPEKDLWDLCFTSYTHIFADGTPYLVTGVLSNRNLTRAYESPLVFDDITFAYASTADYSTDIDVIGYDWKTYDFDLSTYVIQFDKVYIIRSVENRYYKLRFLDFYDAMGAKGAPAFELQEIIP